MKPRMLFTSLFAVAILVSAAFADSPITSTDFAKAYQDEPIVAAAADAKGVINDRLMEYLVNEYNPIDVKMAVINQIGWQISGRKNSQLFLEYLAKNRGYSDAERLYKKGKDFELLSYAYLKAMDNYFEVDEALRFADRALKENKGKSRTFHLIAGLIKAQKMMDSSFCAVYQITDGIRKNEKLMNDMRTKAIGIIYEYMDIYGESC
ncbi:MAG: hypothetical protein IPM63_13775 [Acidobacteriota bacterium]|nr:MAG: hypothetical protein IPM63_13775 [Acidobacteriota bacterium]